MARDTILEAWGGKPALVFGGWKAPKPRGVKTTIQWCKTNVGAGGGDLRCPRVIANRIDGGCDYLPDPDWVPPATTPASPPLPPEVLQAIAELNQKEQFGPPMYSGGPTYRNVRGCETHHFPTSPLSPEQQHLNMINHLKGLHGPRGH